MSSTFASGGGDAPSRPPVAIGGVGGSGTRMVAALLASPDCFIGSDLNGTLDNLWFTLLFKRPDILLLEDGVFSELAAIFAKAMGRTEPLSESQRAIVYRTARAPRPQHTRAWLKERARRLMDAAGHPTRVSRPWGWKEPSTHVSLERLRKTMPSLRYIHVVRNGLDMAYGANQNELLFWGSQLLGRPEVEPTPSTSLKYWCAAHRRVLSVAREMGRDFFWLNYDALCTEPEAELPRLLTFLGIPSSPTLLRPMIRAIAAPASLGRFRIRGLDTFDPSDVDYVAQLGFSVSTR